MTSRRNKATQKRSPRFLPGTHSTSIEHYLDAKWITRSRKKGKKRTRIELERRAQHIIFKMLKLSPVQQKKLKASHIQNLRIEEAYRQWSEEKKLTSTMMRDLSWTAYWEATDILENIQKEKPFHPGIMEWLDVTRLSLHLRIRKHNMFDEPEGSLNFLRTIGNINHLYVEYVAGKQTKSYFHLLQRALEHISTLTTRTD